MAIITVATLHKIQLKVDSPYGREEDIYIYGSNVIVVAIMNL